MFRRISLFTLIVCVLSLFLIQHVSYADIPDSVEQEKILLDNTIQLMNMTTGNYSTLKGAMDTLIQEYKSNRSSVRKGAELTVSIVCGGIITAGVAISSGGSLAPAAFAGVLALNTAGKAVKTSWKTKEIEHAMGVTLSAMDGALSDVNKAHNGNGSGGTVSIELYIDGSLVTRRTIGYNARYKAYLTACAKHINQSYSQLDTEVNMNGNAQVGSHAHLFRLHYKHWSSQPPSGYQGYRWNTVALPYDYECEGTCNDMFRSPHEALTAHRSVCGNLDPSNFPRFLRALEARAAEAGCGDTWYSCDSDYAEKNERHKLRTCTKDYISGTTRTCGDSFRRCMGQGKDHNLNDFWPLITKHSDESDDDDDDTASAPDPPSPEPSTPSYHACGVHETSESGDHSAASCGTSGHYACDGSDHSLQASCTVTNSNGDYCTVASFYACQSHTCQYPTAPEPESTPAPTPEPSLSTCINGHSYDPNNPDAYHRHHTKTCRFSECRQTWANCSGNAPICNKPYRNENGLRCWAE